MIRATILWLAGAACLTSARSIDAADPPLTGKWVVKSAVRHGKEAPSAVGIVYEFLPAGELVIHYPGGRSLNARYRLNREPDPDEIDIETDEDRPDVGGGGPRLGILAIKDDNLTLCINSAARKPRPAKLESKAGQVTILYELTRKKE
jgi:uncharacterized protein (TIGR03067 family)